jgi:hypothetical protein
MIEVASRMPVPRALYCDFPLGRPLGRPNDPAFQRAVLDAAFALLDATEPTIVTYPETILDDVEAPLACPMPPRLDPNLPRAVDEARGLRRAFDRAEAGGLRTAVDVDAVEPALRAFQRVVDGTPWEQAEIPENPLVAALNVRSYYEQAAAALSDHVPAARAGESWFARETEAGELMHEAQQTMKDAGAPFPFWFYLLPASQHRLT